VEAKDQQIQTKLSEAEDQCMQAGTMAKQGITPKITSLNITTKPIAFPMGKD